MARRSHMTFLLLVAALVALFAGAPVALARDSTGQPLESRLLWTHNYGDSQHYYALPAKSALQALPGGGFLRAEYDASGDAPRLVIESYDPDYEFVYGFAIPASEFADTLTGALGNDLSQLLWGGVYFGASHNYVVTGAPNPSESDSSPVIQVTQFTPEWDRSGVQTIRGANTKTPFAWGSCAFAEDGDRLYIKTCHEMYQTLDGLNHQASMTFVFSQSPFGLVDQEDDISSMGGSKYGFASHSFNQLLVNHRGEVYSVDQGDYNPRGVVVKHFGTEDAQIIFQIQGGSEVRYQYTNVSVDGVTSSERANKLLVSGTSIDQNNFTTSKTHNVWLSVIDPSLSGSRTIWLTDFPEGGEWTTSGAKIAKASDDRFLVMWNLEPTNSVADRGDMLKNFSHYTQRMQYVLVDGNGNKVGDVHTVTGVFSDNGPVLSASGKLVWYSTGNYLWERWSESELSFWNEKTAPVFFSVDPATGDFATSNSLQYAFIEMTSRTPYTGSPVTPTVLNVYDADRKLTPGVDYEFTTSDNVDVGNPPYVITALGGQPGRRTGTFNIKPADIHDADIEYRYHNPYTGSPMLPELHLSFNGKPLVEGVDYRIDAEPLSQIGFHGISILGMGNFDGQKSCSYHIFDPTLYQVHRMYNQWTGDHLYTTDSSEVANLSALGWRDEGTHYAAVESTTSVYRLYNPYTGEHHYTSDMNEYDSLRAIGWLGEGHQFYSDDDHGIPVHRLWNGYAGIGNHVYVTTENEFRSLLASGWHDEQYGWYYANY